MAELLGTVVGVVSLGLQVCSGITKYLDGIKGHKDEIASASRLCQSLQGAVDQIQAMRNNIAAASRGHDTAIEQAMMAANAELAALRTFVDEVRGNDDSSKSISEWIKDRTNRVTYPFRRGHLDRLESQLLEANKALQSAIQATQLAISIETVNVTRSIGDEVTTTRSELNAKLDNLQQASTDCDLAIEGKLSDGFSQLSLSLDTFVPQAQQHMEASSLHFTRMENRIEEIVSALVSSDFQIVLRRVLTKPDALRLACREAGIDQQSSGSLQTARESRSTMDSMFSCRCKPRRMRKQIKRGFSSAFVTAESLAEKVHAPDCPLAGVGSQKSWSFCISTKAFRTLMSTAITFSMSSTSGAGGFSICPSLRINFICNHTPAFRIINVIKYSTRLDDESFSLVLQKGLQTLRWMFKSGKASPLDVDIDDGSLLYAATNGSGMQSASGLWKLRPFLEYLVAIGVPRDQPDEKMNELPFHSLFKWSAFRLKLDEYSKGSNTHSYKGTGFASVALDYQFLMPDDTSVISDYAASHRYGANSINMKFFREVARALPGMTEWYGNELHTAIIQKNEVKLVEILKKDTARATLWETDTFGCAALELLTCWTQGMQLVFFHWGSQILQDDNCQRLSVLCHALNWSTEMCSVSLSARCPRTCVCADNVVMLLEAGCLMKLDHDLLCMVQTASLRAQEAVFSHLKRRREELAYLAMSRLSPTEIKDFGISEKTRLDIQTEEVVKALERRGIPVPQRLQTQVVDPDDSLNRWSLYHLISTLWIDPDTTHFLNMAHSHGFREFDQPDNNGITPSLHTHSLMTFMNLVKMSADSTRQDPGSVAGFTATHRIFATLDSPTSIKDNYPIMFDIIAHIRLSHDFPFEDECICECTGNGCHPYSMTCKQMVKNFWFDNNNWKKSLDRLSNLMAPVLDGNLDVPEDFKSMAVRMATFEALSIHHTCCVRYGVRRDIDDEDIQEFLEEDSRAIEILHELLPEFEAKLVEMSCSFSEFLRTYWKERMAQVLEELNEPQPLTKDNLREIKRLGVDLRVEDEDVDKAGSECGLFEFYMAYLDGIME